MGPHIPFPCVGGQERWRRNLPTSCSANTCDTEDAVNITDSPRHATISESTESNRRARVSRTSGLPPGQYYRHRHRGAVAQLGEHLNGIEGVGGSSPPSSTIFRPNKTEFITSRFAIAVLPGEVHGRCASQAEGGAGRRGILGHYPFFDNPKASSFSHSCTISLACSLASRGRSPFSWHNTIARRMVSRTLNSTEDTVSSGGGSTVLRTWTYSEKNPTRWRRRAFPRPSGTCSSTSRNISLVLFHGCGRRGGFT